MRQPLHIKAFRAAEGNWRAAEVLYAHLGKGAVNVIYSYGLLTGFSIELYLRVIIHIEHPSQQLKVKRSHNPHSLAELYGMLSEESRTAINDYFNVIAPTYEPLALPESILSLCAGSGPGGHRPCRGVHAAVPGVGQAACDPGSRPRDSPVAPTSCAIASM